MNRNLLLGKIAEAGFSQSSLAEKVGLSKNTMNAKVNGKSSFSIDEACLICDALGILDSETKTNIFLSKSSPKRDDRRGD